MAKEYKEYTRTQRALVERAAVVRERLVLVAAACRQLFADPELRDAAHVPRTSRSISEKLYGTNEGEMMLQPPVTISFQQQVLELPLEQLTALKETEPRMLSTRKCKQLRASLEHIGLIEPLAVFPQGK